MTFAVYCNDHRRQITFHSTTRCSGLGRAQIYQTGDRVGIRRFEIEEEAKAFAERSRKSYGIAAIGYCKFCCG